MKATPCRNIRWRRPSASGAIWNGWIIIGSRSPSRDFELQKYARLCAALDIPIAGTETTRGGPWGVAQGHCASCRGHRPCRCFLEELGCYRCTLKIAHLAEAHGLRCEVHCTTMGFMDMANLHVSCAIRNCE